MKAKIPTLAFATLMVSAAGYAQAQDKVFFLLPNSTTIRFESRDAALFVEAMKAKAPNAKVVVQNAQGEPSRQQRLVEDALSQGAKVILLASADSNLAAGSLAAAAAGKRPGGLYDHDAVGGKAEA